MNRRTWTIGSFFSVAMAALLLGALLTNHIRKPDTALATPAEPASTGKGQTLTLDTFRDIARSQTPGVVNINTSKVVKRQSVHPFGGFDDDLMERFFGPQAGGGPERQTQRSLGSGFVVDREGYILTNRHVVEGADEINVELANGKRYDAKLVGRDARTDVALVKIDPKGATLTVMPLGNSDDTDIGEWVMAVGNPFGIGGDGRGGPSVTVGVVSYKGRPLNLGTQGTTIDMIQTDAAINPGNSGGPLINTRGEVIGINTLIITRGLPQSAGVGFAVPINVAKEILPQLREKGKVVRGWLGVQIQAISEDMARTVKGLKEAKGAIVSDVTAGSPAEKADVRPGDVVTAVDDKPIADSNALSRYIASKAPGTTVRLQVLRDGASKSVPITLGTFPDETETEEQGETARGKLGMTLRDLTPSLADQLQMPRNTRGVVVMRVEAGEAAEDAGLQQGDVITGVNGTPVDSVDAFESAITQARPDGVARLRIRRGNQHTFLVLKLE